MQLFQRTVVHYIKNSWSPILFRQLNEKKRCLKHIVISFPSADRVKLVVVPTLISWKIDVIASALANISVMISGKLY